MRRDRCGGEINRRWSAGFSMIEVLLVMIIIGILCAIAIPMYLGQRERAKNAVVREGGRSIAVALLSYVEASDQDDPWPAQCDQATLAPYLPASEWPQNPFTGQPMKAVAAPADGDYTYEAVPAGGGKQHLRVYLHGAADFLVP